VKKYESAQRIFKRGQGLTVPKAKAVDGEYDCSAKQQHSFKTGNESAIHKLSLSLDKENFISADINCVTLWNLNKTQRSTAFKIYDNGPKCGLINSPAISSATFN
jgi:hypothetical protein